MHLPCVRIAEATNLQINNEQASQAPVKKHEIHSKPGVIDPYTPLPTYEGKVITELEEEVRQVLNQSRFEIRLRIFVLHVKKFKDKWIADSFLWR